MPALSEFALGERVERGPAFVFRRLHPPQETGAPCPDFGTWDTTAPNQRGLQPRSLLSGLAGRSGIHPRLGKKGTGFSPYIHRPPIFLENKVRGEAAIKPRPPPRLSSFSQPPPTTKDGCPMSRLWDVGYHEPTMRGHPEWSPRRGRSRKPALSEFALGGRVERGPAFVPFANRTEQEPSGS